MDTNTLITNIILFPIGIFITWIITKYYYKKNRVVTRLQPFIDYSTDILTSIKPEIKDKLIFKYNNLQIYNLFELKFVIANTGNTVINKISKPLTLSFSDDYELLNVEIIRIVPKDREINIELSSNSEQIKFLFNLLNPGEYFEFKVLLKVTEEDELESEINILSPKDYNFKIEAPYLKPTLDLDYLYKIDQSKNLKEKNEDMIYLISGIVSIIIFGGLVINVYLTGVLFDKFDLLTINFIVAVFFLFINLLSIVFISFGLVLFKQKPKNYFKYNRE